MSNKEMMRSVARRTDNRLFGRSRRRYGDLLNQLILPECNSVLDVGCGANAALMDRVSGIPYSVGVDLEIPPEPSEHKESRARHTEYRRIDVRSIDECFAPSSFDCVVALDLVEHLEKEDGYALLQAMEHIASTRVIVFTPNGYLFQPPAPHNPFQEHVCGWTEHDFAELGYRVIGINGWKPLRGPYGRIRWYPKRFWERVSASTQPFTEFRPRWAFHLLCVKDL